MVMVVVAEVASTYQAAAADVAVVCTTCATLR